MHRVCSTESPERVSGLARPGPELESLAIAERKKEQRLVNQHNPQNSTSQSCNILHTLKTRLTPIHPGMPKAYKS